MNDEKVSDKWTENIFTVLQHKISGRVFDDILRSSYNLSLFKALHPLYKHRIAVTVAVLTLFAGCEETHDGRVDVSGCCVTRSHRVNL